MTFASVLTGFDRQLMRSNLEVVMPPSGTAGCEAALDLQSVRLVCFAPLCIFLRRESH